MSFNTMHYTDMDDGPDWRSKKCDELTEKYLAEFTEKCKTWSHVPSDAEIRRMARHRAIDATYG
jgi:hypothetical protein